MTKINLDTVLIGQGLEEIPFGSSPDVVRQALGAPDSRESDDEGDQSFTYEKLGLELTFWADLGDGLGTIGTERPTARLRGRRIVGQSMDRIRDFIRHDLEAEITDEGGCVHQDGHVQSWVDVDSLNLSFWFRDHVLYLLDWSGEWVDDQPAWYRRR